MRTCGLSHQIKGPTTVKLAKTGFMRKIVKFTITGPLIWCDNPQVRMSKILYINNNNFHHLGRSQICAGGCYVFRTSKPHSGTLWALILTSARGCRFDPPLIITKPHSSQPRSSRFLSAVLSFILHLVMTQFEIFILSNFNFKLLFESITFLYLFSVTL